MHDAYTRIQRGRCSFCRVPLFDEALKVAMLYLEVATFGVFMHQVAVGDSKKQG